MAALVAIEFRDTTLRKRLLNTHPSPLKECVRSREGFWSMHTYTGQNVLGQIFMNCREFIRKNQTLCETCQAIGMCTQQHPDDRNVRR